MFGSFIAKLALGAVWGRVKTNAAHDWHAIPPKLKLWLIGIVAVLILAKVHQIVAHHIEKAKYHAGYVQAQKDDAARAAKLKSKIDALTAEISANRRKQNDEGVAHNASTADTIRLRGPGRAVCSQSAAAAGGHVAAQAATDAPLDLLPDAGGQLIALPFDDTVDFAKSADDWRTKELSWEGWYADLLKVWPSLFKAGDKSK